MSAADSQAGTNDPLPLHTPRLILRRFCRDDAVSFQNYRNDPDVARYQSWTGCTASEAESFVGAMARAGWGESDAWFQIAIEVRATGALAGDCACRVLAGETGAVTLGYTLSPVHQRQGYAMEAVPVLLHLLLVAAGYRRVIASTDPRNVRSVRLLQKLGFVLEAHERHALFLKGEWCDDLRFALSREAWRARA